MAAGHPDACSLLTTAQISAAVGVTFGAGESSTEGAVCQWIAAGPSPGHGKTLQVDIMGQIGNMSGVDRFNAAKQKIGNQSKTPITGVGDEAYYVNDDPKFPVSNFTSINVRKGNTAFNVHLSGMKVAEVLPILKTLAQQAASKL
jgi:hypothetical protein